MPINPKADYGSIVSEIIHSWRKTGRIGKIRPRNAKHALRIARAVASHAKGLKS